VSRGTFAVVSEAIDQATIGDAKRQVAVDRILRAVAALLGDRGLDVTMDEVAAAAGVGRRTLFRYFESREKLLAAALEHVIERYGEQLPSYVDDWQTWLRALCDSAHRMQATYGPGYWELVHRADLPDELAEVDRTRRARRRDAMRRIASKLWRESGGQGRTPAVIEAVVASHLSARFTAAVIADAGQTWQMAADLAYDAISAALDRR
jgi:AcrR family transcriptional regulator